MTLSVHLILYFNIIAPYGATKFSKSVRETCASFIDVEFAIFFTAVGAVDYVRGGTCEVTTSNEVKFGSRNSGSGNGAIH